MTTVNEQVGHNDDDAHENAASLDFSASFPYIKLHAEDITGYRYNGGFRFTTVAVPQAATIDAANVELYLPSASNDDANVDILANDVDDANDFSTEADVTSRARTAASASWVEDALGTGWHQSPEIKTVIKEIVDREDWASGNALCVLIDGKTTPDKDFYARSHDASSAEAAKLDIDYTAAAGGVTVTPPTATLIISAFVPVIKLVIVPPKRTLSLATFTPVLGLSVIPPPLALSLTAFAPTVTTTGDVTVTPGTIALSLAVFAPVIKLVVIAPTLAFNLQTFAPTISTPRLVTPSTAALSLTAFAPTVSAPRLVTPGVVNLSITVFAPTVTVTSGVVVTPGVLTLSLSLFAPTVSMTANVTVTPGVIALSLTTFAPTVTATGEREPRGGMSPRFGAPPGWLAKEDEELREPKESTLGRI